MEDMLGDGGGGESDAVKVPIVSKERNLCIPHTLQLGL